MPLCGFAKLMWTASALHQPVPIAVAGGADRTVLAALRAAINWGWIAPLVFGDEANIRRTAAEHEIGLDGMTIASAASPAAAAAAAVRAGAAHMLMKGQIATPELLHALLDPRAGLRAGRVVCQVC
jgi:phosphotransacetylase